MGYFGNPKGVKGRITFEEWRQRTDTLLWLFFSTSTEAMKEIGWREWYDMGLAPGDAFDLATDGYLTQYVEQALAENA